MLENAAHLQTLYSQNWKVKMRQIYAKFEFDKVQEDYPDVGNPIDTKVDRERPDPALGLDYQLVEAYSRYGFHLAGVAGSRDRH